MRKSNRDWTSKQLLIVAVVTGSLSASGGETARAGDSSADESQMQSVAASEAWLVSTRCVPLSCPAGVEPEQFSYQVSRGACTGWEPADSEAFFGSVDDDVPVIVFIHGNRADRCDAIRDGWAAYQQLLREPGGRTFRFVIWSWPADQIRGGPRQDALVKAGRSDAQSFYLAAWLERLPPGTPVTLIGYSFGARVICGALHLAEGGTLIGMARETSVPREHRRRMRVMLVAAALDSEWLLPGSRNGLAAQAMEQMMLTRNCCDPVLRLYPRMRRYDSSSALGFAGPVSPSRLAESGLVLETVPVESQVGRDHSWYAYLRSNAVRSRIGWYAFLEDEPVLAK
jgi:hypothetical protein